MRPIMLAYVLGFRISLLHTIMIISLMTTVADGIERLIFPCSPSPASASFPKVKDGQSFMFGLLGSFSVPNSAFVPDFLIGLA